MSKTKTSYFCQSCGAQAAKWAGKCNSCGEWNTMVEEVIHKLKMIDCSYFQQIKAKIIALINLYYCKILG